MPATPVAHFPSLSCVLPGAGGGEVWEVGVLGLLSPQRVQRAVNRALFSVLATYVFGIKKTFVLRENVTYLCLQEAEAFALYHKALDLQKHDQFEESAKAYHELLEARLLREVRCPEARMQAREPGILAALCSPPPSWLGDLGHMVSPVCPSARL